MQISASNITMNFNIEGKTNNKETVNKMIKDTFKDLGMEIGDKDIEHLRGKDLYNAYYAQSIQISISQFSIQGNISEFANLRHDYNGLMHGLKALGDDLKGLTPEKAKEMISEDGYWGANKTGERIADFVINGAGDDLDKLKAGREGILRGFGDAKKLLGSTFEGGLSDLANSTMKNALEKIDKKIAELGGNVLDIKA